MSGLLADEMGLGKTAQAIAMLAHLRANNVSGPFLVIAPLSTLSGWMEQFAEFCPALHVIRHSGSAAERASARRRTMTGGQAESTVVVSSYEGVLADAPELNAMHCTYVVIDEAHRLKSRASAVYRCLLDEMGLGHVPRLLLTGTPLQNRADEFFSLLHFVAPELFDDADGFVRWVAEPSSAGTAADIGGGGGSSAAQDASGASGGASLLWRPLMLRRLKADHLHLPPKREVTIRVPMTSLQRHWYRAVLERNYRALGSTNTRSLVNVLASLRKCCNHPYLFDGAEPEPFVEGEHLVDASAKLATLDRLLRRLRAHGDRVLLFSQSTQMLDVLQVRRCSARPPPADSKHHRRPMPRALLACPCATHACKCTMPCSSPRRTYPGLHALAPMDV